MRWILPIVASGALLYSADKPEIPKTWSEAAIASLQVPLAMPSASPAHIKTDAYHGMTPRPVYI